MNLLFKKNKTKVLPVILWLYNRAPVTYNLGGKG